jgi:RNA-directed DNA polymerase
MTRRLLDAIYEPVFLDTSYGFRPGRSGHDAWRQLNHEVMREPVNWRGERDRAQCVDPMPHTALLAVLAERIADQQVLRRIARMLKAGGQTPGGIGYDERGSPQGSSVSPVIAQALLDYVLDQWVVGVVRPSCHGSGNRLRYAADARAVLETEADARRFVRVLPLRLGKCGRRLNTPKTPLVALGQRRAWQVVRGGGRMSTVAFLGFTHYWGRSPSGKARRKRQTSKKRLRRALGELKQWLRQERHGRQLPDLWQASARKMQGHCKYFGVTDNSRALYVFEGKGHHLVFRGLNRRSQRRSVTWESFRRYFNRHPLPRPGRLVSLIPVG